MARGDALLLLVVARADIVHVAPVVALLLSLSWPGLLGWLAVRTAKYTTRTHAAWGTGGKEPQWVEVGFWPGSGICYRTGPIAHVCDAKRACRGCLTRAKPHRGIPPPGIRPVGLAPQDGVVGLFQLKGVAAATEDGKGGARIDGPQPK